MWQHPGLFQVRKAGPDRDWCCHQPACRHPWPHLSGLQKMPPVLQSCPEGWPQPTHLETAKLPGSVAAVAAVAGELVVWRPAWVSHPWAKYPQAHLPAAWIAQRPQAAWTGHRPLGRQSPGLAPAFLCPFPCGNCRVAAGLNPVWQPFLDDPPLRDGRGFRRVGRLLVVAHPDGHHPAHQGDHPLDQLAGQAADHGTSLACPLRVADGEDALPHALPRPAGPAGPVGPGLDCPAVPGILAGYLAGLVDFPRLPSAHGLDHHDAVAGCPAHAAPHGHDGLLRHGVAVIPDQARACSGKRGPWRYRR